LTDKNAHLDDSSGEEASLEGGWQLLLSSFPICLHNITIIIIIIIIKRLKHS